MSLITTFGKGFIASTNIVVFKKLKRRDSKWFTPNLAWEVELDSMLTPDRSTLRIIKYSNNYKIGEGIIHAYLKLENIENDYKENIFCFKAIIPKETRFWIQDDLDEIASEKLHLTSERVDKDFETDLFFLFSEYCLDLLLKDGRKVRWSSDINLNEIKGIFAGSQVIGLDFIYGKIFSSTPFSNLPGQILEREEAEKDFSGRERTKYLRENYPDLEILKKLPEDSYIPSLGELSRALENFLFINLTRKALGLDILEYDWFWSSTPHSDKHIWYVYPDWGDWSDWYDYRCFEGYIFPFLDLP